jgi:predicted cupin superfamily sugar epimerase
MAAPRATPTADEIKTALGLKTHPIEGGFFRETYRSARTIPGTSLPPTYSDRNDRALGTAIYYFLTPDTFSEFHRLPTEEVFHLYLGGPVRMWQLFPDGRSRQVVIGADIIGGQEPQVVVPSGVWQGSYLEPGAPYALLGATVAPGFDYADYVPGDRATLIDQYPGIADEIRRLTRDT